MADREPLSPANRRQPSSSSSSSASYDLSHSRPSSLSRDQHSPSAPREVLSQAHSTDQRPIPAHTRPSHSHNAASAGYSHPSRQTQGTYPRQSHAFEATETSGQKPQGMNTPRSTRPSQSAGFRGAPSSQTYHLSQEHPQSDTPHPRRLTRAESASAGHTTPGMHTGSASAAHRRSAASTHSEPRSGSRTSRSYAPDNAAQSAQRPQPSNTQPPQKPPTGRRKLAEAKPQLKSHYIPGLDGLRALAVLAVIAYHMGAGWAKGGLLGVTVFFVLSGYLITSLLLIELHNTDTINLPQFWLRRVRRLFPAIVLVIVVCGALFTIFNHELLTKMRTDTLPALCWVTNWWYIFHDVSYFEALGAPSPLTHFWSLAIEEQFYLFWPVILFVAHKLGVPRPWMRNATLVVALLSAAEMALLFDPTADPSRVYYGTDTRAFSLLIGAWLAYVWPSHQLGATGEIQLTQPLRRALDGVGIAALIYVLAMIVFVDGFAPFLYRGGILLTSLATAIVIAVLVHPASLLGRFASLKPFVWIGKRSYGIYLWHYPIILLITPPGAMGETPFWLYLVEIAVILIVSDLSYRFVENPIRHGAIGEFARNLRSGVITWAEWLQTHILYVAFGVISLGICIGGFILVPDTSAIEGGDLLKDETAQVGGNLPPAATTESEETTDENATQAPAETPKLDVLMIGDSISVRTIPYFEEMFPYGVIDAAVNRQLYVGEEVFDYYDDMGIIGDVVVFALGTNGPATDEQLDSLIEAVGPDRQIYFITTRSPQAWVSETNDALWRAQANHDNVTVIDWYSMSDGNWQWFEGDGTHLNEEGAQAYIAMINDVIGSSLPVHDADDVNALDEKQAEDAKAQAAEDTDAAGGETADENAGETTVDGENTDESTNEAATDTELTPPAEGENSSDPEVNTDGQ